MKSPVARARENEHMYIDPKIHILRNVLIAATLILLVVLITFFVQRPVDRIDPTKIESVTGILEMNETDQTQFSILQKTILNVPDLSKYVGKKVVLTGVVGSDPDVIEYRTIVAFPDVVVEKKPVKQFFTAHSDHSFVISHEGENLLFGDISKPEEARVQLNDVAGNTIMEFMRTADDGALTPFITQKVAVASKENISVGGFPFVLERVIPMDGNGMIERAVRSSQCVKKERCPSFAGILYNATIPENEKLFRTLLSSIVFLPDPQGWKLFKQNVEGAKWDFFLFYPASVTIAVDELGNNNFLAEDSSLVATLNVLADVPKPPDNASQEILLLPTRKETLYHLENQDRMILKMPEGNGAVELVGRSPIFDAMIRTFTFVQ